MGLPPFRRTRADVQVRVLEAAVSDWVQALAGWFDSSGPRGFDVVLASGDVVLDTDRDTVVVSRQRAAAVRVDLPRAPALRQTVVVKDGDGAAAAYNVVVYAAPYLVDGAASDTIATAYRSRTYLWTGEGWAILHGA